MVGGGLARSPFSMHFDRYRIPRIQAVGATVTDWLQHHKHPGEWYVSDGDASMLTIPRGRRGELRQDLRGTRQVVEVD